MEGRIKALRGPILKVQIFNVNSELIGEHTGESNAMRL